MQHERAERLLEMLQRGNDAKVELFLNILSTCRQNDIRNLIVSWDQNAVGMSLFVDWVICSFQCFRNQFINRYSVKAKFH